MIVIFLCVLNIFSLFCVDLTEIILLIFLTLFYKERRRKKNVFNNHLFVLCVCVCVLTIKNSLIFETKMKLNGMINTNMNMQTL